MKLVNQMGNFDDLLWKLWKELTTGAGSQLQGEAEGTWFEG